MVEVDFINYNRPWENLKEDEEGDTMMFEITEFEVSSTEEREAYQRKLEAEKVKRQLERNTRKLESKIRNKLKRIILQDDFRRFYYSPGYILGRSALAMMCLQCDNIMSSLLARFGLYLFSHVVAYCWRYTDYV